MSNKKVNIPDFDSGHAHAASVMKDEAVVVDSQKYCRVCNCVITSYTGSNEPICGVCHRETHGTARTFDTGATRDTDEGKWDYEGFLSPLVLARYAEYMHKNRIQSDGELRDSDNWQKGIPKDAYMKSMWRHFMDVWMAHRGEEDGPFIDEALCAMLFNVMGYLYEELK